jgi:hypothetical protein
MAFGDLFSNYRRTSFPYLLSGFQSTLPAALSVGTLSKAFSFHFHQKSTPKQCLEVQPRLSEACEDLPDMLV